uniref:CCHC-type domain-containing protein n=1 Tax=Rhizochromulina marina TaxID=1034831 RepID=A0A7S2RYZ0_9STRA|mmetsp:Transcript_22945/g.66757  ORF Transcript_22945/g.66757 Transcript_22945/m.66757 type:complete len:477 (+) Transcript_22945:133-1563(+)
MDVGGGSKPARPGPGEALERTALGTGQPSPPRDPVTGSGRKRKLSSWLTQVLSSPRPRCRTPPPVELEPVQNWVIDRFRPGGEAALPPDRVDEHQSGERAEDEEEPSSGGAIELPPPEDIVVLGKVGELQVKVRNLWFGTTKKDLLVAMRHLDGLVAVELEWDDLGRPAGRAMVTFRDEQTAEAAVDFLEGRELGGRTVHAQIWASHGPRHQGRYWHGLAASTLAMKCFHCGRPGHKREDCPDLHRPRPCKFCARSHGNSDFSCPEVRALAHRIMANQGHHVDDVSARLASLLWHPDGRAKTLPKGAQCLQCRGIVADPEQHRDPPQPRESPPPEARTPGTQIHFDAGEPGRRASQVTCFRCGGIGHYGHPGHGNGLGCPYLPYDNRFTFKHVALEPKGYRPPQRAPPPPVPILQPAALGSPTNSLHQQQYLYYPQQHQFQYPPYPHQHQQHQGPDDAAAFQFQQRHQGQGSFRRW